MYVSNLTKKFILNKNIIKNTNFKFSTFSKESQKLALVIGGGSSGITAAKSALEVGFNVEVIETSNKIGGNWVYNENAGHSSVYKSTSINTSKDLMSFSDFPLDRDLPAFPSHFEIASYFEEYANNFNVTERVKFNHKVVDIKQVAENDKWEAKIENIKTKEQYNKIYDFVYVCSGHHHEPLIPTLKSQDKFKGKIMHSHFYKVPDPFNDQTSVVVGIGNSGVDIATELGRFGKMTYLSTRSGAYVLPKYAFGYPLDSLFATRLSEYIPFGLRTFFLSSLVKLLNGDMKKWNLNPKYGLFSAHPTVSSELLPRIASGCVVVKPDIKEIKENSVVFVDGSEKEVDNIILATGYKISFPFLSQNDFKVVDNKVELYENVFSPNLKNLCFIGLVQPVGAIFPIAEMQSRWASGVFSDEIKLPNEREMRDSINNYQNELKKRFANKSRHTIQVDFLDYLNRIAEKVGCKPSLIKHLDIFPQLFFGPATPVSFRLDGPHSWKGAKKEIKDCYKNSAFKLIRGKLIN